MVIRNDMLKQRCPFYGCHTSINARVMIQKLGNQCGHLNGDYPCQMEVRGEKPEWYNCRIKNDPELKASCLDDALIEEFGVMPMDGDGEISISFREWFFRVMGIPYKDVVY